MTSAALKTRPVQRRREQTATTPRLRVIESQAGARAAFPIIFTVVAVLIAVLVVNLFFTTRTAEIAYDIRDARAELVQLNEETQALRQQLQVASSPGALKKAALDQGMVPAGQTGFIQLSNATVEGGSPAAR